METLTCQVAEQLNSTLGPDKTLLDAATGVLDALSKLPGFPLALISISTGSNDQGLKIAAATFLKNFTKRQFEEGSPSSKVTLEYKNQLAQALLVVEPAIFRVLIEALRFIIANTFVKENSWPELVHELKSAIQNSNLFNGGANCQWKTLNALSILQALLKPFQYFLDAKLVKEPVPPQLEQIAEQVLVPLLPAFHCLVDKALSLQGRIDAEIEKVILIICKCIYFSVRSHMPAAIAPQLPLFCGDLFGILDSLPFVPIILGDGHVLRFKAGKRGLLIFCALVTRHRKHADRLMADIVRCSIRIVKQSPNICNLDYMSERVISLAFDVISHILESGPGWRLVSPHFPHLLESAIFPALKMNQKDIVDWEEDGDEYMRKNLPSDLEEVSGWKEDLFTARKSAINLLGIISISKGPPVTSYSKTCGSAKRKKGENHKNKERYSSVGELLVMPFLSKFATPSHACTLPEASNDYYGVLMAYGGLQDFLRNRDPQYTTALIQTRVLPLYLSSTHCPYLLATANWILGELASCLSEEMSADVYSSLLKSLVMPDVGHTNSYPVRVSSAGAIAALLENDYLPPDWLPLLQVLINSIDSQEENESTILFQLLTTTVEVGSENVAMHIPATITALAAVISKHLPPLPEPWPQVVERGFGPIRAMAQIWESSIPDESYQDGVCQDWICGWATTAKTCTTLLQKAWLTVETEDSDNIPLPSCLDDVSVLLGHIIKFIIRTNSIADLGIQKLLQVWADMIADWHAWEEVADMAMFDTVKDVVSLHTKVGLRDFFFGRVLSPPAPPVPQRSIIEGITAFVVEAFSAHKSAVWRACLCAHVLLHMTNFSLETEGVRQMLATSFSRAAFSRFIEIRSKPVVLWKSLLLVISSCYLSYPDVVENVLLSCEKNGFAIWAGALVYVITDSSGFVLSKQEVKLAVLTLAKVVERLVLTPTNTVDGALKDCFISLMKAVIHMKELPEGEDEADENTDDFDDQEIGDEDCEDDEESEDDHEETEEEFLERYAKTAAELESGLITEDDDADEAEELELGALEGVDPNAVVFSLVERYQQVFSQLMMPSQFVTEFLDLFPEFKLFFKAS